MDAALRVVMMWSEGTGGMLAGAVEVGREGVIRSGAVVLGGVRDVG